MKKYISLIILSLCFFTTVSAKNELKEMTASEFSQLNFDDLKDGDGVLVRAPSFLAYGGVSPADKKKLPASVQAQFNEETQLIAHQVLLKLPKNYEQFTSRALKNRGAVEKHLLYNSDISLDHEDFSKCLSTDGVIKTDMNLPKFLEIFDYPEKLECKVTVNNPGTGIKFVRPEILKKLSADLGDKDVRFISLDMSECNMIFKGISQNVLFLKASDGNTLILFDNYSLVKKSTLQKIDTVKMFTGSPTKFINGQVKKNMTGLLKFINASLE